MVRLLRIVITERSPLVRLHSVSGRLAAAALLAFPGACTEGSGTAESGETAPNERPTVDDGAASGGATAEVNAGGRTGGQAGAPSTGAGAGGFGGPPVVPQPTPSMAPTGVAMAVTEVPKASLGVCSPAPPFNQKHEPEVQFSLQRGWYSGNQTVTLTPVVPGAELRYAVGGGIPEQAYQGPIAVTDNGGVVTVRARASAGGVPGRLQTHSFLFLPNRGGAAVVMTDNDLKAPPDEDERTVTFEFIPPPQSCLASVVEEAGTVPNMGGSSAGASDKVYFRGEYGNGKLDADLFGDHYYGVRPTVHHDHLYLRADHTDWSFLRNIVAHDAALAVGQLGMHGRFVDFFENGKLLGTRYLHERPEGGFMESYTGIDKKQWLAVSGVDALGTMLDERTNAFETWEEVNQSIDVRSLVDFLLVQWQAAAPDFQPTRRNWRGTGPIALGGGPGSDYRWHFFNWDLDRAYRHEDEALGSPMDVWERIDQFPEARLMMQDRVQCAFSPGGPLTIPVLLERFNARLTQLQMTSLITESGKDLTGEAERLVGTIEPWLVMRMQFLFENVFTGDFSLAPAAVQASVSPEALLTLSSSSPGSIYYRVDGGDPRTPSGSLDPAAMLYSEPVPLPAGESLVMARWFDEAAVDVLRRFAPACNDPLVFDVQRAE